MIHVFVGVKQQHVHQTNKSVYDLNSCLSIEDNGKVAFF